MLKVDFWNIAFTVINLLVLYWFMRHFLVGRVRAIINKRQAMIEQDLDSASNSKNEALEMKKQYEKSIGHAGEEAARIVEAAKTKAELEYEKVMNQAKTDAQKKLQEAEMTMAVEREKAMHELETSIAGLAMVAAAKLLEEQKSGSVDQDAYNRFIAKAGEGNE